MNISETFIRRPIATSLIMLGIALFGVISYQALPVSDLPNVDYPTITVYASLPGADPSTMASAVATPLERQFTTIAGIDSMTSTNRLGNTQITLQFDIDRDIDGAAVDVQTAISAAMPLLPPGLPSPPSFRKVNPADSPVMFFGLYSDTLPLYKVDEYAETLVAQRLSMVNGVAQVNIMGQQKFAVHIQADPAQLAARKIGINELSNAVRNWNVNLPTGTMFGPKQAYTVETNGQLMNAAGYRDMIVAWRDGIPVRLSQVATAEDGVEDDRTASWLINKEQGAIRAINLMVMRQPGSNVIEVTDEIKKLMPFFNSQLPPSVTLTIRGDRSKNIRDAFVDIKFTLVATLGLVIMVIFVFLRNVPATIIPSLALPFSVFGTFALMYLLNFSLDNLSMMALILSVGFIVDDAIVVLENTVRHLEHGETPLQAALNGSREVGFTIVSMTLSLAAVFIPILFMGGILGKLFREFAITICAAVLFSGLVSITLTPMLCSRMLRPLNTTRHGSLFWVTERFFQAMHNMYARSLSWVLHHRPVMMAVFLAVLGATGYLYVIVPKGFIPEADNDQFYAQTEMAQGTSYHRLSQLQEMVNKVLLADPNVESFFSMVGNSSFGSANSGRMFLQLKPREDRDLSAAEVINELRPKLSGFPGVRVFLTLPPVIRVGGRGSRSTYEFTLQGPDTQRLQREAQNLEKVVATLPSVLDVNSDLELKTPRVRVEIDRDRAAALGINAQQIESSLYDAYGPSWISTIYDDISQHKVMLELLPKYQRHADMLSEVYLKSSSGELVPLQAVTHMVNDAGPQSINHTGQLPSVSISFSLKPGVPLGRAVDEVEEAAAHTLPRSIKTEFSGTAKVFESSMQNMALLLTVAILVVYIVLGMLYESYIHPLTILSGLPSAGFGALLTLTLFKVDLSIYSFVGLMMLIGIVKKNAIMQIDFALEAERREGKDPRDAVYEGCLTRFRPIMMTTMCAFLGALPMALGYGSGGEARRPLGLAVMGGLAFSQVITLYLTPVVYTYMAAILERITGRKQARVKVSRLQEKLLGAEQ
ncbi:MAG: efflux RND transporter permease subunit [Bryobacterales bacterium]|nr:efflux RND transporter permease subunit [Bryobacterales bacterium]